MNCLEFREHLNDALDTTVEPAAADAAAHLAQCPACRELASAARLFSAGLASLPRPQTSALLTQSIVAGILEDRRQRQGRVRRRIAVTFALAASIVLLMIVGWLTRTGQPDQPPMAKGPVLPQEPAADLGASAEEARVAVSALTERVADRTKEQAKLVLAAASKIDLAPMAGLPNLSDWQEPLDPAAKSLRVATQTVASGIEPITNSARRALTFFARELPVFDLSARN